MTDAMTTTGRDVSTLADMRRALEAESAALTAAIRDLEAARASAEAAARHAVNYSDEWRAVSERDHAAMTADAEQAAAARASAAEARVRAILAELPAGRMVVDPAVEAVAASRAVILGQVIQSAPLVQLRDELKAAIVAGDRANMYVMGNLLPARLAAAPAMNEAGQPEVGQARREIADLLSRVRDDLRDTAADPIRALAAEVRDKAATARRPAETRRREEALAADFASGRRVPWPTQPDLRAS